MANIVITTTTNAIKVVFNGLSDVVGVSKGTWQKRSIISIVEKPDRIEVYVSGERLWEVSFDNVALQVDSVNSVAPISNSDLYSKLSALVE
jgi:hypothetical protein